MDTVLLQFTTLIGFAATVSGLIYLGRKLQILDNLHEDMGKVKHNLKAICDFLITKNDFDPKDLKTLSPLQLTEEGKEKISRVGFDKIFEENKAQFFTFIASEEAKTKYDVEIASIKSISVLFDQDFFQPLKSYYYNNPEIDEQKLNMTLGIYVRDAYLSLHPEVL